MTVEEYVAAGAMIWHLANTRKGMEIDGWNYMGGGIEPLDGGARMRFDHAGITSEGRTYGECLDGWLAKAEAARKQTVEKATNTAVASTRQQEVVQ